MCYTCVTRTRFLPQPKDIVWGVSWMAFQIKNKNISKIDFFAKLQVFLFPVMDISHFFNWVRGKGLTLTAHNINTLTQLDKSITAAQINKHCEFLVSCSDKERNCMQTHETACKLMELHVSSFNFIKVQGTVCKVRELHASSCNCMQAHITT